MGARADSSLGTRHSALESVEDQAENEPKLISVIVVIEVTAHVLGHVWEFRAHLL